MLKTTKSSKLIPKAFGVDNKTIKRGGSKADEMTKNLSMCKKLKNTKSNISMHTNIRATKEPIFLTLGAKKAFNQLK